MFLMLDKSQKLQFTCSFPDATLPHTTDKALCCISMSRLSLSPLDASAYSTSAPKVWAATPANNSIADESCQKHGD